MGWAELEPSPLVQVRPRRVAGRSRRVGESMDGVMSERGPKRAGSGRTAWAAAGAALALALTGCGVVQPGTPATTSPTVASPTPTLTEGSPSPAPSQPTESATPTNSPTPTGTSTATPTGSPTGTPAVKATGTLLTFSNLVSDQLTGTCQVKKDVPTLTLADKKNDFYETVEIVVTLKAGRDAVASVRAAFGEDFEGTTRKLVHPDTGTSAKVSVKGSTYTVTGKVLMYEGSSKKGSLVPITLTATCAGEW